MSKPKQAPYIALKTDFRKDDRFEVMGQIAGYNKYEALGRMAHLWAWCRDRKLLDAPEDADSYVVSDDVVAVFLGERGIKAILAADVDCLALGQRWNGKILLRGTSETVGALRQRIAAASAGGIARSAAPRVNGRYPSASRDGGENQPTGWNSPAETVPNSSLIRPPTSDHQKEDLSSDLEVTPEQAFAEVVVGEINRIASKRYSPATYLDDCKKLLKSKFTAEQGIQVVRSKSNWLTTPNMADHFVPKTLLRKGNFARYLDELNAKSRPMLSVVEQANNASASSEPDLSYSLVAFLGDV